MIIELLHTARDKGASDLHLRAGQPPFLRVHGSILPLSEHPALTPEDLGQALAEITTDAQRSLFGSEGELEFAYTLPEAGRYRANVSLQRGTVAFVFRVLPTVIPTLEELGIPPVCQSLAGRHRGLVIVTGPTGSGKSTTLAAMLNYLNETVSRHVVTIEDPIEYVHHSRRCLVSQRELGADTRSFATALKHVLRQDPNVILVGEMRDTETAAAALTAAETGHLVLTTGHAPSAPGTIDRILSLFPPHQEATERARLAMVLEGVLSQTLVPRGDGKGRVAAVEVMLATPAVRNLIRDGKTYQLPNVIRSGTNQGMQTMDQALLDLYRRDLISGEEALARCSNREEIEKQVFPLGRRAADQEAAGLAPK
ncbi:MAG: type IV pilus twitching motility protein PilT [Chloroflexota bacterium]